MPSLGTTGHAPFILGARDRCLVAGNTLMAAVMAVRLVFPLWPYQALLLLITYSGPESLNNLGLISGERQRERESAKEKKISCRPKDER